MALRQAAEAVYPGKSPTVKCFPGYSANVVAPATLV